MSRVAVAILDHDDWRGNADIIALVDDEKREIMWIPRDLWWPTLGDRINRAIFAGGCDLLLEALQDFDLPCDGAISLRRGATEAALNEIELTVQVDQAMAFWYPLTPNSAIEDGRKVVVFNPPSEMLSGERVHQWIGARISLSGTASDLDRIERQKVLLTAMLRNRFDFTNLLTDRHLFRTSGDDPIPILRSVAADWAMTTLGPLRSKIRRGKLVLVRPSRFASIGDRLIGCLKRAVATRKSRKHERPID